MISFREQKIYGVEVDGYTTNVSLDLYEAPESKCNTVTLFAKTESQGSEIRNLLAVSESYICYSIRKQLLRIINTVSTEKSLLRGHASQILDLKFSSATGRSTICSVDEGDGEASHTFIWEMNDEKVGELSYVVLGQFPIGASIVQPHPNLSGFWAIASNQNGHVSIGIISHNLPADSIKSYKNLPVHVVLPAGVIITGDCSPLHSAFQELTSLLFYPPHLIDLALSSDGRYLAAALSVVVSTASSLPSHNSCIMVWRVPVTEGLLSNVGSGPADNGVSLCYQTATKDTIAIRFVAGGIAGASKIASQSTSASVALAVQVRNVEFQGEINFVKLYSKYKIREKVRQ